MNVLPLPMCFLSYSHVKEKAQNISLGILLLLMAFPHTKNEIHSSYHAHPCHPDSFSLLFLLFASAMSPSIFQVLPHVSHQNGT